MNPHLAAHTWAVALLGMESVWVRSRGGLGTLAQAWEAWVADDPPYAATLLHDLVEMYTHALTVHGPFLSGPELAYATYHGILVARGAGSLARAPLALACLENTFASGYAGIAPADLESVLSDRILAFQGTSNAQAVWLGTWLHAFWQGVILGLPPAKRNEAELRLRVTVVVTNIDLP